MSALAWALLAVPLGAGGLLSVSGRRGERFASVTGVAAALATLALACAAAVLRPTGSAPLFAGIRAGVAVDGLSSVLVVTVASITVAVLVFSAGDVDLAGGRCRFFGLMLLFAGSMLVTVTATTLALLLMGWEVMGATSWALIGFWWRQPHRVTAGHTAFLTTRAADLGLYLAAGAALAGGVGSLRLDALPRATQPWLTVLTAGVMAAALGKSAQLPFSFWLSRAMEGPSPVSALLHSAAMVAAGAYLLLRLGPLLAASGWAGPAVAWLGVSTALLLGLVAVAQSDLKQLLAASTCAQIGFMVLAAGAGGVAAGTGQLVAHAATKSLLFLGAGAWLTALGTKQLPALRGVARRWPVVGAAFTAGALTLAGLAPLSLWATKDEVLAVAGRESPGLYAAGLAAAIVSTVYSVRAGWYVLRPRPGPPDGDYDTEQAGTRRVPAVASTAMVPLALAAVALGVLALPGPAAAMRAAVGESGQPSASAAQLVTSAVVALAVAALTWRLAGRRVHAGAAGGWAGAVRGWAGATGGWLARWLSLERAVREVVVRPTLALARTLAAFDDRVIDRAVHRAALGGLAVSRVAARLDDGGVDGIVTSIGGAARRLGALARRPQTGLLHHYYAQAAVAIAALVVLLLVLR
jgi:NADH-quinone oxidoreductase subunit L